MPIRSIPTPRTAPRSAAVAGSLVLALATSAARASAQAPEPPPAVRDSVKASVAATARVPDSGAKPRNDSGATRAAATKRASPAPAPVWPVRAPAPLPGSILPARRIIAYYGNPKSKRMGILGEIPPDQMLTRLDKEVAAWAKADTATPVLPALHLIAVVAQASAGRDGKYRARMSDSLIEQVASWAARRNAVLFLDVQVGKSTLRDELPRLVPFLSRPNVHLGLDPEFSMKGRHPPGKRIGTMDATDINYAIELLSEVVTTNNLPPKVLVVHRFTRPMLTNAAKIRLDPRVQVVIQMDGFGPPWMKKDSYQAYVYAEPVQFTGFKLFYKNDKPRMTPEEILQLNPKPVYIQYQ